MEGQESTENCLLISYGSPREDSLSPLGSAEHSSKAIGLQEKVSVL